VLVENNRVILRNAAAIQAGIGLGSTLATAHSIAVGLNHCNRDEGKEQQRLRFLAEALYRFTSQVSLQLPHSLVLEVSGSLNLFSGLKDLKRQIETLCEFLGHRTLLQKAKTPSAALTLAWSQQRNLADAGLQFTELDSVTQERFANMGIHTLGPLLALPETELAQRFGPGLLNFLHRLTGRLPDPREGIVPSATFANSLHLLEPINNKDALLFPMQRLLGELHVWLVGRQMGAEQIRWRFQGHSSSNAVTLPVSFAQAQQSQEAFLNITRLKLEGAQLPEDVLTLGLMARRLVPWCTDSHELFQTSFNQGINQGAAPAEISELVDQLRARLGNRACHGICVVDQHSPEQAWRMSLPSMGKASGNEPPQLKRPLWLFDPPRAVTRSDLTLLRGPERIKTAWWQQGIHRDYYVARHKNGAECWAFLNKQENREENRQEDSQEHAQDQWYLHGYFA
jgi:protein ImuB